MAPTFKLFTIQLEQYKQEIVSAKWCVANSKNYKDQKGGEQSNSERS